MKQLGQLVIHLSFQNNMMLTIQKLFFFIIIAAVILSQNHHLLYLRWPKVKLKVDNNATYYRGSSILVLYYLMLGFRRYDNVALRPLLLQRALRFCPIQRNGAN